MAIAIGLIAYLSGANPIVAALIGIAARCRHCGIATGTVIGNKKTD